MSHLCYNVNQVKGIDEKETFNFHKKGRKTR